MARIGRPKKYSSAKTLREAVDAYIASISYETPAVVSTATGEVTEEGKILYTARLLKEGRDGTGPCLSVTNWLEPPSTAALCLYLGVSRSTWANYAKDEKLGAVVDYWETRYEAYLVGQLERGKHISGVIFNLQHNFGWKERREVGMDAPTRQAMAGAGMTMAEKLALLEQAAADFGGGGGDDASRAGADAAP